MGLARGVPKYKTQQRPSVAGTTENLAGFNQRSESHRIKSQRSGGKHKWKRLCASPQLNGFADGNDDVHIGAHNDNANEHCSNPREYQKQHLLVTYIRAREEP